MEEENLFTEPEHRIKFGNEKRSKPLLNPLNAIGLSRPKRAGSEVNDSEHVEDIMSSELSEVT